MAEVLFSDGTTNYRFPIIGDIEQTPVMAFKQKLGIEGAGLDYSDFTTAEMVEWWNFTNGIGR